MAEQGDARAQVILGIMLADGRGVAKDEAQGGRWFRKAAEQGEARAQHNLAVLLDNG